MPDLFQASNFMEKYTGIHTILCHNIFKNVLINKISKIEYKVKQKKVFRAYFQGICS